MRHSSENVREVQHEAVPGHGPDLARARDRHDVHGRSAEFERFQALMDVSHDLLLVVELPSGRIRDANRTACRQLGISREALLDASLVDLATPDCREVIRQTLQGDKTPDDGGVSVAATLVAADGSRLAVEIAIRFVRTDGQHEAVLSIRDVAEHNQAEDVLQAGEALYKTLVEDVDLGVTLINSDYEIVMTNAARGKMFAKPTCDYVGSLCYQEFGKHGKVCPYCPGAKAMATRRLAVVEAEGIRGDGTRIPVAIRAFPVFDADGTPNGFIEVVEDIRERRWAEEELAKTQALLMAAIEQTPAGIIIADAPDVKIRVANSAALGIRGKTSKPLTDIPVELHPQHWQTFHPDGTPYRAEDLPLSRAVLRGEKSKNVEVVIRRSDGESRCVLANAAPVRNARGEIIAGVVVFPDITERKQAEEALALHRDHLEDLVEERSDELEKAQEALVRQERLATLGQLTATVSHELRNPLGTIRTCSYLIGQRVGDTDPLVRRSIQRVERGIVRCDAIIADLLDYSSSKALKREPTDLTEWISGTLAECEPPPSVSMRVDLQADVRLALDRERFRRCLVNVLSNAWQAMEPSGGTLTLTSRVEGAEVVIGVADTGRGITAEQMPKVFEPLYSTKTFGVGLGLPIIRQIVQQHKGEFELKSVAGQGTTATIRLPLPGK